MRILIRCAGFVALAAVAASASEAQTPPASEAPAVQAAPQARASPEAASSLSPPYVSPMVLKTIRLRGSARAVLRLREGGGPGSGRFAAAAAVAAGALGASGLEGGLRPLGGDLRLAEIDEAQLEALIASGALAEIHLDRLTSVAFERRTPATVPPPSLGGPAETTPAPAPPASETAEPRPLPPDPSPPLAAPAPAEGPAVAVIDTGVDPDHPYLRGVVIRQACFSSTVPADRSKTLCPNGRPAQTLGEAARPCDPAEMGPLCGHGTKVAGLISGRGGAFGGPEGERPIEGIAPGAPILAIQVFSRVEDPMTCSAFGARAPCPLSYVSDQIAALRFVSSVAAEHDVAVANLSLSSPAPADPCDEAFEGRRYLDEIAYLLDERGVATVAAAGNAGLKASVGLPACVSRAVAVAALDAGGEALAGFSNVSPSADLAAPGVGLASSTLGETLYAVDEGTSFAAPQVSGALLRLKRRAPGLHMSRLSERLRETGRRLTAPGEEKDPPALDLAAALASFDLVAAAPSRGSFATAASSGGSLLPPRLAPANAPTGLSPEVAGRLRPNSRSLSEQAVDPGLLTGAIEFFPSFPPAPPPAPVAPPPPALAGGSGRFLFEIDPALAAAALREAGAAEPAARAAVLRGLVLQAAPAEAPVTDLRLDPETGRGLVTFETRLDSRQAESLAEGFPGRLAPDRLAAP